MTKQKWSRGMGLEGKSSLGHVEFEVPEEGTGEATQQAGSNGRPEFWGERELSEEIQKSFWER